MLLIRSILMFIALTLTLSQHHAMISHRVDNYELSRLSGSIIPKETYTQKPTWFDSAHLAASLIATQNHVNEHFVKSVYARKHGSNFAAFGINWSLGVNGSRHATFMRGLLLTAGDIESNPGPTTSDEKTNQKTNNQPSTDVGAANSDTPNASTSHDDTQWIPAAQQQHRCPQCGRQFQRRYHLTRHVNNPNIHMPKPSKFPCPECGKVFSKKQNMQVHQLVHERKRTADVEPGPSNKRAKTKISDAASSGDKDQSPSSTNESDVGNTSTQSPYIPPPTLMHIDQTGWEIFIPQNKAFEGDIASYRVKPIEQARDPKAYLESMEPEIQNAVDSYLEQSTGIKLQLSLRIKFFKPTNMEETCEGHFLSFQTPILTGDNVAESVRSCIPKMLQSHEEFIRKGSGWVDDHIIQLDVYFSRYQPLKAGCIVALPKKLRNKKGILNIHNSDNKCFLWCIIAADRMEQTDPNNRNRVENYEQYEVDYDTGGINYPVTLHHIRKFEKQNDISINVFSWESNNVIPIYVSKLRVGKHVNLFYHQQHYFLITSLDRFLSDQRGGNRRKYFCHRCLHPTMSMEKLSEHLEYCSNEEATIVKMATEKTLKFKNVQRMQRRPVVVYADFECLTQDVDETSTSDAPNSEKYQRHVPCGYALLESKDCCGHGELREPRGQRGPGCVEQFLTDIVGIATELQEDLDKPKKLTLTEEQQQNFNECTECHICKQPIEDDAVKVKDHCHMCGRFRGVAHSICNVGFRLDRDVTVIFHNLRRYDGHLLMQEIGATAQLFGMTLTCIAKSMEDYLSFSLTMPSNKEEGTERWRIRFIDSYQFLGTSLENLAKALPESKFKITRNVFTDDRQFTLMRRKGVYPYDYMSKWERFNETELPSIEKFYNLLNESDISETDYEHAKQVWKEFNMKTMADYHDLYLQTDVLILYDVFEEFRALGMDKYGLDPTHYITLPSMAWDACLKITDVELELLQDPTMYSFFENGIRGGISTVTGRHAKANNNLCERYDPSKPNSFIMYKDANNLYGWAMVQKLPTDGFRWLTQDEINELRLVDFKPNQERGYVLEVDLEYPEELHDLHSDYPLAAEKLEVSDNMLSEFCRKLKDELSVKSIPFPKLVPNLNDKKKYIIHSWQLHLCLELGLNLRKIHRGIVFNQRNWLAPYITLNTEMRKAAKTEFEKSMFKLMNNAVFGKTMENKRHHKDVKLPTSRSEVLKLIKSPRYKQGVVFNDNLAGIAMTKKFTKLDKPIYVGFSVLEISKVLMYEFHYKHMLPKYGDRLKLLFTDTDSFMYLIQTENIYKDIEENLDLYDTSDYPQNHPLYSNVNKKVLGKMKDEMSGQAISEFIGLKSKMYSFLCGDEEKKRAKGIKKTTVAKHVTFAQYSDCVHKHSKRKHEMRLIRSVLHELYSMTINKVSLTPYDDKRYILNDGYNSLAYGHYRIPELETQDILQKVVNVVVEEIEMDIV